MWEQHQHKIMNSTTGTQHLSRPFSSRIEINNMAAMQTIPLALRAITNRAMELVIRNALWR
jgi:hypothetical protein